MFCYSAVYDRIGLKHAFFKIFPFRRYFAFEIHFHHQSADRHAVCSAETGIFDKHANGDFGVVHRGESHECGMVAAMRILRCAGFPHTSTSPNCALRQVPPVTAIRIPSTMS